MSFDATMHAEDGAATIRMAGELDSGSAGQLEELIDQATGQTLSRLVLLMDELTYTSSAGLRCLVFAQQKMGDGADIVLVGARPEVAETIKLTGFDRSVVMEGKADGR